MIITFYIILPVLLMLWLRRELQMVEAAHHQAHGERIQRVTEGMTPLDSSIGTAVLRSMGQAMLTSRPDMMTGGDWLASVWLDMGMSIVGTPVFVQYRLTSSQQYIIFKLLGSLDAYRLVAGLTMDVIDDDLCAVVHLLDSADSTQLIDTLDKQEGVLAAVSSHTSLQIWIPRSI